MAGLYVECVRFSFVVEDLNAKIPNVAFQAYIFESFSKHLTSTQQRNKSQGLLPLGWLRVRMPEIESVLCAGNL